MAASTQYRSMSHPNIGFQAKAARLKRTVASGRDESPQARRCSRRHTPRAEPYLLRRNASSAANRRAAAQRLSASTATASAEHGRSDRRESAASTPRPRCAHGCLPWRTTLVACVHPAARISHGYQTCRSPDAGASGLRGGWCLDPICPAPPPRWSRTCQRVRRETPVNPQSRVVAG